MRHASQHLLGPGFRAVPASATVSAVLLRGQVLRHWADIAARGTRDCAGAVTPAHVHAQPLLETGVIKLVSEAFEVFHFNFALVPGPEGRRKTAVVTLTDPGPVDGILLWWECCMSSDDSNDAASDPPVLSTAPSGVYRRDHWRQAIHTRMSNSAAIRAQLASAGLARGCRLVIDMLHNDDDISLV